MSSFDILFNIAMIAAVVGVLFWCVETWKPKPYAKYHMVDQAKRWGHK